MKRIQGALRNRAPCIFICLHLRIFFNYTDHHDVDEEMRTIVRHGGWYVDGNLSGFTCRFMRETPTNTSESVASSNMKNSQILYGFA